MGCAKRNFSLSRCPTYRTLGINGLRLEQNYVRKFAWQIMITYFLKSFSLEDDNCIILATTLSPIDNDINRWRTSIVH